MRVRATRFFNVMGHASLCQTEAKSSSNARRLASLAGVSAARVSFKSLNALLLCRLRVPARLQYIGHQAIAGVDLIVLRKARSAS